MLKWLKCHLSTLPTFSVKPLKNFNEMFLLESRENTVLNVIGIDIPHGLAYDIQFWVRTITFLFIGVGFINLFKNHKKLNFEFEYVILSITSILLLIVMVALPFISFGYGITRFIPPEFNYSSTPICVGWKYMYLNFVIHIPL